MELACLTDAPTLKMSLIFPIVLKRYKIFSPNELRNCLFFSDNRGRFAGGAEEASVDDVERLSGCFQIFAESQVLLYLFNSAS